MISLKKTVCAVFLPLFVIYSCTKKNEIEKTLISHKDDCKIWTICDLNHEKIDTLNLPIVMIFKDDNTLESFSIINGVEFHDIDFENDLTKKTWIFSEDTELLSIGMANFKVINSSKDSLILKTESIESAKKVLLKLNLKK